MFRMDAHISSIDDLILLHLLRVMSRRPQDNFFFLLKNRDVIPLMALFIKGGPNVRAAQPTLARRGPTRRSNPRLAPIFNNEGLTDDVSEFEEPLLLPNMEMRLVMGLKFSLISVISLFKSRFSNEIFC